MNNQTQQPKFSVAINSTGYQKLINNTLQDPKRASKFITNITSAVAVNPQLQACDAGTILSGALLGEALNLSPSPQLGHFYLVPFKDKNRGLLAQFILGYKGYIQLAIRSGQYKKLNVVAVKEGELVHYNPFDEEIIVKPILDETKRTATKTIGYYAMFEYTNGFKKSIYWSKEKMESHALQYSSGYKSDRDKGTNYTFWSKDFDGMAFKTMIRQLLSKWGIMSLEMTEAYEKDGSAMNTDGTYNYVENQNSEEQAKATIEVNANTGEVVDIPEEQATDSGIPSTDNHYGF